MARSNCCAPKPPAEDSWIYMGEMDMKDASQFFNDFMSQSIPKPPPVPDTIGYLYFETPDLSVATMDQEAYIRSHLGPIMNSLTEAVPLFYSGVVMGDPRSPVYRHFHTHVFNQLKKQWSVFRDISPILTKDRIINRFMMYLRKSHRYTKLPPLQYNFCVALSINLFMFLTSINPDKFSPTDPDSLKLILSVVDDIVSYLNLDQTRALALKIVGTETSVDSIMRRVIYMTFCGIYFDPMFGQCLMFTEKIIIQ